MPEEADLESTGNIELSLLWDKETEQNELLISEGAEDYNNRSMDEMMTDIVSLDGHVNMKEVFYDPY